MDRLSLIRYIMSCSKNTDTLFIKGTGSLTKTIVQNAINNSPIPISDIKFVVIEKTFTSASAGCLDAIDESNLPSNLTLVFYSGFNSNIYTNLKTADTRINKIKYMGTNLAMNTTAWRDNSYLREFYAPNATSVSYLQGGSTLQNNYLPKATSLANFYSKGKTYAPKFKSGALSRIFLDNGGTLFISNSEYTSNEGSQPYRKTYNAIYFSANHLGIYLSGVNGNTWTNQYVKGSLVGVIDGADIYQDINDYEDMDMNYPKLSSTLTIDINNGHLIENDIDLFDGYIATWYSNEQCTTIISPADITSDMTVYVKLTAI